MRSTFSCLLIFLFSFKLSAQENIPVGTWRLHLSYNDLNHLTASATTIYGANTSGVLVFHQNDQELSAISKMDGLSSSLITAIDYSATTNELIIGHENGLISILKDNELQEVNALVIAPSITGSRKINHIYTLGSTAYLSTDFGVVVFNLINKQVKETYRDLSFTGDLLFVNESVIHQDTLWLATEAGVLAGSLAGTDNLLDFRNWKRYDTGFLAGEIQSLAVLDNKLYAAIDYQDIYEFDNGIWTATGILPIVDFNKIKTGVNKLIISANDGVWTFDGTTLIQVGVDILTNVDDAIESGGSLWIADGSKGMVSFTNGNSTMYSPNAPSGNTHWKILSFNSQIVSVKGGISNGLPLNRDGKADQFVSGKWSAFANSLTTDLVDFAQVGTSQYVASFGSGLEEIDNGVSTIYTPLNSPLSFNNTTDQLTLVSAVESSGDGLWVINYGATTPLYQVLPDKTWKPHLISLPQASFTNDLTVDFLGNIWMVVNPGNGGGIVVYNPNTSQDKFLTNVSGQGGLPSSAVRSIAIDRDGAVWVGTDEGVVYFSNPGGIFANNTDAVRPIFENRFLLRDESITAIAVDGGNRKWLGTRNGVWLFSPTGEDLIYNFTQENSPLPSNEINSIGINPVNGEVFFATANGLASFRSDASAGQDSFSQVRIFPNPVDPGFTGLVTIDGLYTDAVVKITDTSGKLVWQTQANGGTASWSTRQLNGDRVNSGMYLVFATSQDGGEKHVGKIAVIE